MKGLKQYIKEAEEKSKDDEKKKPQPPQQPPKEKKIEWSDALKDEMKKVKNFIEGDALEEFIKDSDLDGDYGKQLKEFLFIAKKIIKAWGEELEAPDKYGIELPKSMREFYKETLTKLADQISDEIGGDPSANQEFMVMLYGLIWRRATGHSLSDRCENKNDESK